MEQRVQPKIRVFRKEDLEACIQIDKIVSGHERQEYYERKLASIVGNTHNINASLVAELDGKVVGFMMGDIYFGEYGIPENTGTVDNLGVHPDYQNRGIASDLIEQFLDNMKVAGVKRVYTLVNWDDFALEKFFNRHKFVPSKRINLEYTMP